LGKRSPKADSWLSLFFAVMLFGKNVFLQIFLSDTWIFGFAYLSLSNGHTMCLDSFVNRGFCDRPVFYLFPAKNSCGHPICVGIKKGNGLKKDSVVNSSQIRTIDKKRLIIPKIATLSGNFMENVDEALKNSLALS